MKNFAIIVSIVFFGLAMSCGSAQASDPIALDFDGMWSWGTSYTFNAGTGTWEAGTATNPSNPWDGSVSQDLVNGVTTAPDGKEDTYGIARVNTMTNTANHTTLFDRTTAPYELTVLFYGFDDIYANGNTAANVDLRSTGGRVLVYRDTSKDYNPANPPDASTDRTAVNQMNTITNGVLALDLVPHALTDGINTYTMEENFNFGTFRGTGSIYFDIVGGDWASLYDTNGLLDGSDINFAFSSFPSMANDPGVLSDRNWLVKGTGQGQANLVPEPLSMIMMTMGLFGVGLAQRKRKKLI